MIADMFVPAANCAPFLSIYVSMERNERRLIPIQLNYLPIGVQFNIFGITIKGALGCSISGEFERKRDSFCIRVMFM